MKNQELAEHISDLPQMANGIYGDGNLGDFSHALNEAQDAGLELLRKNAALSPERELAVSRSFWTGDYVKNKNITPDELVESKVVDASNSRPQFFMREPEQIKEIKLRLYSERTALPANYKITADGKILQIRHPEQADLINDDAVIIDFEKASQPVKKNGSDTSTASLSEEQERQIKVEKQNALLRQMVAFCQVRYGQAKLTGDTASDFESILHFQTCIPRGTKLAQEKAFEDRPLCHRLEPLPNEVPEHIVKYHFGRTSAGLEEERYFSGFVGAKKGFAENEDIHQYLDKIVALISRNEGGFTSINPNDRGAGISVGIAQWNQQKGELPRLFMAWHKADSAKFNRIFGVYAREMLDETSVRTAKFFDEKGKATPLCEKLKIALADEKYQEVQVQLVRGKALRAWRLGVKYNHVTKLIVAEIADMGNQMGWGLASPQVQRTKPGIEDVIHAANIAAIPDGCLAVRALQHRTQDFRVDGRKRDKRIEEQFDPAVTSSERQR